MALIVLIILGLSLGWFSSVFARSEGVAAVARQMGVGVLAALAGGAVLNGGSILGGLSMPGLGAAVAAAFVALVLFNGISARRTFTSTPAE